MDHHRNLLLVTPHIVSFRLRFHMSGSVELLYQHNLADRQAACKTPLILDRKSQRGSVREDFVTAKDGIACLRLSRKLVVDGFGANCDP